MLNVIRFITILFLGALPIHSGLADDFICEVFAGKNAERVFSNYRNPSPIKEGYQTESDRLEIETYNPDTREFYIKGVKTKSEIIKLIQLEVREGSCISKDDRKVTGTIDRKIYAALFKLEPEKPLFYTHTYGQKAEPMGTVTAWGTCKENIFRKCN